ncbi:MAG: hypothetical protein KAJ24_03765 [Candidatus Aenigmarchaeota archaeon]|nr:hypothetical protein [Candidatus Aenigmarchaeota archaeon]
MWLDLFTSLGFLGFYTVWALFVGSIAFFGILRNFGKKGLAANVLFSWIAGAVLISTNPVGALVFAVFLRLLLEGIKIIGLKKSIKKVRRMEDLEPAVRFEFSRPGLFAGTIIVVILLSLVTAVFSPPHEVEWYNMYDASVVIVEDIEPAVLSEISWNDISDMRLVSQEYALQVPKTMVTETGWKLSSDWDGIYSIDNTLYWVMAYEPTRIANNGKPSPAYIIVNAQNPADRRKISEDIEFSEERGAFIPLAYQIITGKIRDVQTKYWLKYPFFSYGDTVFTHDSNGTPVWFAPVKLRYPTKFLVKFYTEQVGVVTLDNDGAVVFYSDGDIRQGNAPAWLLDGQVIVDEEYSYERVWKWAKYDTWKGFLNYQFQHENVFELAREMYFQYDKDTGRTYGLFQLEPEGKTRKAITQYIEIDASGTEYGTPVIYDTRALGLIGPERALDDVRGEISLYSDWYALQPLFKKIKGGYFYVVPVYSGVREAMVLKAVAVVDAKSEQVRLFGWGEQEVKEPSTVEPVKNETVFDENCHVVSSETVEGKLRITIECEE